MEVDLHAIDATLTEAFDEIGWEQPAPSVDDPVDARSSYVVGSGMS